MTRRIINKVEPNYIPLTKAEERNNLREHLLMMLEAMQYSGPTKHFDNDRLREIVEDEKIKFLHKLQVLQDSQALNG